MEVSIAVLTILSIIGIFATTGYAVYLGLNVKSPGIGRILFCSLISLKVWAALVLVYFFINTYVPTLLADYRFEIRLFFNIYLVVQPIAVGIAFARWQFTPPAGTAANSGVE